MAESDSLPWSGSERDAFVRDAADRSFVLDGLPNLGAVPELFVEPRPESIWIAPEDVGASAERELHAVGVYEGTRAEATAADEAAVRPVRVRLRRTSHPVVLFLMSYAAVRWELEVDDDALLSSVVVSSHDPCTVHCRVAVRGIVPLGSGPHAYTLEPEPGEDGGDHVIATLEKLTGLPLASFQGSYYGTRFEVPCSRDASVVRDVLARIRELRRQQTGAPPGPFLLVDGGYLWRHGTRAEPIEVPDGTRAAAFCEADGRYYAITSHALYAIDAAGSAEAIDPPPEGLSWLGGIAFDGKRGRLLVATCWHTGFHHLYDPRARRWTTVPLAESLPGIVALSYEPTRDAVIALAANPFGRPYLFMLQPDLRLSHQPSDARPVACGPIGPEGSSLVQMVAFRDAVVLCITPDPVMASLDLEATPGLRSRGLIVYLDTGRTERFTPDPVPRPTTRPVAEATAAGGAEQPRYEGWIYTADLVRDAAGVLTQVAASGTPLLVIHRRRAQAMIVNHDVYHGQLATLDETSFPDWRERLARATRELAEGDFVPNEGATAYERFRESRRGTPSAIVRWTRQAVEDYARLNASDQDCLAVQGVGTTWNVPMDAAYAGFRSQPIPPQFRVILRFDQDEVNVAYLRTGARGVY